VATKPRRIQDWSLPQGLTEAKIPKPDSPQQKKEPEPEPVFKDTPPPIKEEVKEDNIFSKIFSDNKEEKPKENGGFDPSILLGLLNNQDDKKSNSDDNPMLGALMSMMGGGKPDMMSMLPLIMQMSKKKESDKTEPSYSLDNLTLVK